MKHNSLTHALDACPTANGMVQTLTPTEILNRAHEPAHFVQFYETDSYLLDSLNEFISAGLEAGDACVVIATTAHRQQLEERLQRGGLNVCALKADNQYLSVDEHEALPRFMVDGKPEPGRFAEFVGGVLDRAAQGGRRVRVFGEMVATLWASGNYDGAIRLEEMWNDLRRHKTFQLYCAYPMSGFGSEAHAASLQEVCATHSQVIPAESYSQLTNPDERLRAIIKLQQKARTLEAEIAERKNMEAALHVVKDELELQVEDLRRLHEMSLRLTGTLNMEAILQEMLRAAMTVHGTSLGLLSLCDAQGNGLQLQAHSGFAEEFLKVVEWVPPGGGACGTAYQEQRRVIVEDVESDPIFAPYREAARKAGFRACHSTPLITRNGHLIGVLTVHFRQSYKPTEREMRLMDLYARMAVDFIENARLHRQVQEELTERQQLLVQEQLARAEAEIANRMKDEFLATVSHELRTPLNAIIGWAHMLRDGRLNEETMRRAIETIGRNAKSQAQLIEDILDMSRVVTGKLRLNIEPVDVSLAINAAIDSIQLAADAKTIQLAVILDPAVRHISGDASRFQQIIWNLLSNAIKFTPLGGRIEVRVERADGDVQISVSDTGQGISADFLPFIFDRFRQADGSSTRRHGGLGLGLAIVRHLVDLHGGTVKADSRGEGLGATFTIRLPLAVVADRNRSARHVEQPAKLYYETTPRKPSLPSLAGLRVLLVDDDADSLQMLLVVLRECQAEVQLATSTAEALETIEWFKPDILVSDLAMPGEDGYSLIDQVRALEAAGGRAIPSLALTAYVRVEDRARALSAGYNMFVPKPVEPFELITAIANLAESSTPLGPVS
ncbi:MAG: MEDS domain-containing protein [Acidobacteria bacterium]|nr:MEDS domain-containing protein [Acidobacteriota bacterium]